MNKTKLSILSIMLAFGITLTYFGLSLEQVKANENQADAEIENSASASAEAEASCEAGPYGQCSTRSRAEAEASTKTKIVYVDREKVRGAYYHQPADTALDMQSSLMILGSLIPGAIATAIKIKQLA